MGDIHEEQAQSWAESVFGKARLGDIRRTRRLVSMTTTAALRPAGTIAAVFDNPAELAGAYDLVENDALDPQELVRCLGRAAAERARAHPFVWVPTDGTAQALTDRKKVKGTGRVGTTRQKARGDKLHDALVLDPEGVPLGVSCVLDWQRPEAPALKSHGRRDPCDKETQYWLEARDRTRVQLREHAPGVVLHFLHDREADAWPVLWDAVEHREGEFTTVRAQWDRRLVDTAVPDEPGARKLRDALARTPVCGALEVEVPAGPRRTARTATLEVRGCTVTLDLRDKRHGTHRAAPLGVGCVREVSPVPTGEAPLEWLLLTTYPVDTFEGCCHVVRGYALRWRIERFHAAWKTAGTDLEGMQLWKASHRSRWRLILAVVAVMLLRWQVLSTTRPDADASEVFTPEQVEAVRDLQKDEVVPETGPVTLWQMTVAIAYLGGWSGTRRRAPGLKVLVRGWERVAAYLIGLRRQRERVRRQQIAEKNRGGSPQK
ncbi:MAG: IS4 family transposase [Deltaproteobacteria bacterium]|nr:IS4 family transposase [Deltaproteobacteria bacterium]